MAICSIEVTSDTFAGTTIELPVFARLPNSLMYCSARRSCIASKPPGTFIVSATSLIHFQRNRYSVPTRHVNDILSLRVYPQQLVLVADGIERFRTAGAMLNEAYYLGLHADVLLHGGDPVRALVLLDQAIT